MTAPKLFHGKRAFRLASQPGGGERGALAEEEAERKTSVKDAKLSGGTSRA